MIDVTLEDQQVQAALSRLSARVDDLRPVLADVGEELVTRIVDTFERETDPWGEPWQPHAQSTRRARARRAAGGKTGTQRYRRALFGAMRLLQDTGALRSSIEVQSVSRDQVTVGSRMAYAAVHQFGSARKGIPARAFFPVRDGRADLPASWALAILGIAQRHLQEAL
jgi:phage virion morphogenesis protein